MQIRQAGSASLNGQKWYYDQRGKEIKGMNDYCLDAGLSPKVVIWTCNGGNNQKWTFYPDGSIRSDEKGLCIEIPGGYANAELGLTNCSGNWNTIWTTSGISLPTKWSFRRTGTNQCLDVNQPNNWSSVNTFTCDSNNNNQKWESVSLGSGYMVRRFGTNQCLNSYNPSNGNGVATYNCEFADWQRWDFDWNNKLINRSGNLNNGQCLAKWNPQSGQSINMYQCNSSNYSDPNLKWDFVGV